MAISKKVRQQVYDKFKGKCAYTGKPLTEDWQVDHAISRIAHINKVHRLFDDAEEIRNEIKKVDELFNLLPALRIINHYKRSLDVELFRQRILKLHITLKKLPKKTSVKKTEERKKYLNQVADLFDISIDKPFCGKFYFETQDDTQ